MLELDADDRILSANPTLESWLGRASAELVGLSVAELLRAPTSDESMDDRLPDLFFLSTKQGGAMPVLAAFGPQIDGRSEVTLVNAGAQLAYAQAIHSRNTRAERNQQRLELVIASAVAFADAESEAEIVETIRETATKAYAAEESGVFMLDADGGYRLVGGTNALAELKGTPAFTQQAAELRSALKVSGVEAAYGIAESLGQAF